MKRRHVHAIFAVLALGLLLYVPSLLRSPGRPQETSPSVLGLPPPNALQRLRVVPPEPSDSVRLERVDGWKVNGHRADSAAVRGFLAALDSISLSGIVARNPANHDRLEVSEAKARRVEVESASGTAVLLLGKWDPPTRGSHVRVEGRNEVYLLHGPLGDYLRRTPEDWRDRRIAAVDTATVQEIRIRRQEESFLLRRGSGGWLVDDVAADSTAVTALLKQLADLRATGFPPDSVAEAADFDAADAVLNVWVEEEGDVTNRRLEVSLRFLRGAEEFDPWLVRRIEDSEVYELSSYTVDALLPRRSSLETATPP